jgi:predicted membrane protein
MLKPKVSLLTVTFFLIGGIFMGVVLDELALFFFSLVVVIILWCIYLFQGDSEHQKSSTLNSSSRV